MLMMVTNHALYLSRYCLYRLQDLKGLHSFCYLKATVLFNFKGLNFLAKTENLVTIAILRNILFSQISTEEEKKINLFSIYFLVFFSFYNLQFSKLLKLFFLSFSNRIAKF